MNRTLFLRVNRSRHHNFFKINICTKLPLVFINNNIKPKKHLQSKNLDCIVIGFTSSHDHA